MSGDGITPFMGPTTVVKSLLHGLGHSDEMRKLMSLNLISMAFHFELINIPFLCSTKIENPGRLITNIMTDCS